MQPWSFLGGEINESFVLGNEIDINAVYNSLQNSCINEEFIIMNKFDVVIDCGEISSSGSGGLESIVRVSLEDKIKLELDSLIGPYGFDYFEIEFESIEAQLRLLSTLILVSGMSLGIFLIINIFLSVPKYTATISLGSVGIISALPLFFVRNKDLSNFYGDISTLSLLVEAIRDTLYQNYLAVFIFGITLLVIGIVWTVSIKIGFFWLKRGMRAQDKREEMIRKEERQALPNLDIE